MFFHGRNLDEEAKRTLARSAFKTHVARKQIQVANLRFGTLSARSGPSCGRADRRL